MQTRSLPSGSLRWRRPLASGLSLLLLALQLVGLAHLTLAQHGVCWEHGTLTELGTSPVALSSLAPRSGLPGVYLAFPTARLDDVEGHHHCPIQASRRNWGAPPAGAPLELALAEGPGAASAAAIALRADAGLLRRAPKQSPPPTV